MLNCPSSGAHDQVSVVKRLPSSEIPECYLGILSVDFRDSFNFSYEGSVFAKCLGSVGSRCLGNSGFSLVFQVSLRRTTPCPLIYSYISYFYHSVWWVARQVIISTHSRWDKTVSGSLFKGHYSGVQGVCADVNISVQTQHPCKKLDMTGHSSVTPPLLAWLL